MTKYEDVKHITTEEYFKGNQFSIDAFNKKYTIYDGESYVDSIKRVCDYVASAEETRGLQKYWSERWFDELYNDWWHPAGSIMQGAANPRKISLCNCTTLSLGTGDNKNEWDSLEGLIRGAGYSIAKTAAYRQGLGVDFSRIRPRGMRVNNSSNESTGSTHWMKFMDSIGYYVGQKGRIPAMLFSININHPDIEEFINLKKDYTKIQNANISVQITNDFYKAVLEDKDFELFFEIPTRKKGDKVYVDKEVKTSKALQDESGNWYEIADRDEPGSILKRKVKARKLFNLIARNMYNNAEPGIQNIDIARKYSNSDAVYDPKDSYDSRIISTNACSEQYLSRDSLCVLSSINAGKFSTDLKIYKVELEKIAESINRFLDNINTLEVRDHRYATEMQKESIEKLRRTGAGITNLAAWLFKNNLNYGTDDSIEAAQRFVKIYNFYLYKATTKLGKEKGNFKLFDKNKIKKSAFIQKMIKEGIEFEYMRNVTVSSIAPTGTLSLMFRNMTMSSGIEPAFGLYYWKRTRMAGYYDYYFCVPREVRERCKNLGIELPIDSDTIKDTWDGKKGKKCAEILDQNSNKLNFVTHSKNLDPFKKLKFVQAIAKHIDSSVSVTFMLSETATDKDIENFILEAYNKELKSITVYPNEKLYGIISFEPFKDLAYKLKNNGVNLHQQNFSKEELDELSMGDNIVVSSAPVRPKELDAEIYTVSVKKDKFVIAIGLLNGAPYEMFGGTMNGLKITTNKKGKIIKQYRNKYKLIIDGGFEIDDFSQAFDPVEQVTFRLISANLRHGTPVKFICEQLNKATDDISSLARAASRVLKKYIKDGEPALGLKCPVCGETSLYYFDGCATCSCGFSKCD